MRKRRCRTGPSRQPVRSRHSLPPTKIARPRLFALGGATIETLGGPTTQFPWPTWAQRVDSVRPRAKTGDGSRPGSRGAVLLWDDTFVRYHEPHIGKAAVAVLEAAGFEVRLLYGRRCCGRPAFSQGNIEAAAAMGLHNLSLLESNEYRGLPILFLEPSCYSMFVEDYREMKLKGVENLRCFLFEEFLENLLAREPEAVLFRPRPRRVAIHAHCHAKSLLNLEFMPRLARRVPGHEVQLLQSGCCGMAGAFGMLESKLELSIQIARPLVEQIAAEPAGAVVVASGASCRHQLEYLTPRHPYHMAELLAAAL